MAQMLRKLSLKSSVRRPDPAPDGRHSSFNAISEDSELLGDFRAQYLGSVSVDQPRGDEILASAAKRVKLIERDVVKVSIEISATQIKVVDRNTTDVLTNSPIINVTSCGVDPDDKKQFVYVTKASKGNLFYGHVFQVKEKAADIARAIQQAFKQCGQDFTGVWAAGADGAPGAAGSPGAGPGGAAVGGSPGGMSMGSASSGPGSAVSSPAGSGVMIPGLSPAVASARGALPVPPARPSLHGPHAPSPLVASPAMALSSSSSAPSAPGHPEPNLANLADAPKYDGLYMGSVMVAEPKGMEVLQRAIDDNREMLKLIAMQRKKTASKRPVDGEPVTLIVHPEGLHTVEPGTGEQKFFHFIKNITFSAVVQDSFAYIVNDERLQRIDCHIFQMAPGVGALICSNFQEALRRAQQEEKERGQNPFAVTDPLREPVRGALFAKQIHRADLLSVKAIGAGQFGEVYLAIQTLKTPQGAQQVERAVKLLRNAASASDKNNFLREAETMLALQHRNLVELVGVAVQQKPWLMVVEYMRYGDLRTVLRTLTEKSLVLHPSECIDWCMQIAAGMRYVSSRQLVHMDLAARNCLLGAGNLIKISDFGLTRPMEPGKDHLLLRETLRLPIKWLALECVAEKIFSEASDVWAFGVTAWEVFSYGAMPFANVKTPDVPNLVRDGLRLQKPDSCTDAIFGIITSCWNLAPKNRPNFEAIVRAFAGQLAVHGLAPPRDIGAALFAERAATLPRHASPFAPPTVSVASTPTGGLVRVNSVSRRNPLFQGDEAASGSCSKCGISFVGMDTLGIKLHTEGCQGLSSTTETEFGAGDSQVPEPKKSPKSSAGGAGDLMMLQKALSLADESDEEESSTDAVRLQQQQKQQQQRPQQSAVVEPPRHASLPGGSTRPENPYINTVNRSDSASVAPPNRPSMSAGTVPVYANAAAISRQNSIASGASAPGLSSRSSMESASSSVNTSKATTPLSSSPVPPTAALASSSSPASTSASSALVAGAVKATPPGSPFANNPSTPGTPSGSGAGASSPFAKAAAAASSAVAATANAVAAAGTGAAAKSTAGASSSAPKVAGKTETEEEILARAAAAAEKLKVSSKAESALKVHSSEGSVFSEGKVKRSKIFDALNPQPLAFQTARERAQREEKEEIGTVGSRSYFDTFVSSAPENESFDGFGDGGGGGGGGGGGDGDDDDDEEAEDPDNFDPHNLPDFGDFTEEMMQRRAQRAQEEQRRRDLLAKQFAEKKAREKAEMEKELEQIRKREAIEAAKKKVDENFVTEAQKRLETEMDFGQFTFA